jgi:hypothetical protein
MEGDPPEGIYRAMIEENGMPRLGSSATTLGIRSGKDIMTDQSGMVHRPSFQPGTANGLSCAPSIQDLPRFVLPVEWGGRNQRTSLWRIDESDLGPDLVAQEDSLPGRPRHISVGPARTMAWGAYLSLVEATQAKWKKVTKQ